VALMGHQELLLALHPPLLLLLLLLVVLVLLLLQPCLRPFPTGLLLLTLLVPVPRGSIPWC
jgi:hypothetical protein